MTTAKLYESIFKEESYMSAWYTKVAHCAIVEKALLKKQVKGKIRPWV